MVDHRVWNVRDHGGGHNQPLSSIHRKKPMKKDAKISMSLKDWEEILKKYLVPEIKASVEPILKRIEMLEEIFYIRTMAHQDPFLVKQMRKIYEAGLERKIREVVREMKDEQKTKR